LQSSSGQTITRQNATRDALPPDAPLSSPPSAPWWFRHFMPSATDLMFLLLFVALAYGPLWSRLLSDADIGWHIRNGQQIISTQTVPRTDSFSSTMSGKPWYAWEWLSDLVIGLVYNGVGLNGVVLLAALVIALTFALLFRYALARGTSFPLAVIFVLLAVAASTIHFLARPHLVTWLLTLIWFEVMDVAEMKAILHDRPEKNLYWLPVLMLLWVNLHGGFVLALVLTAIYLLAALLPQFFGGREAPDHYIKTLSATAALTLLVTFLNPYGYGLHVHVFQYLSDRFFMNHINEFLSPNFHGASEKCFGALVLISILTFALSLRRPRPSHLLVALFATYAGLYASRNIPIASILIVLVIAPVVSHALTPSSDRGKSELPPYAQTLQSFSQRMIAMEGQLRTHLWPVVVLLLSSAIALQHGRWGSALLMDAKFDPKRFPVQAAEVLRQQAVHEPVFTPDSWSGYLIYRLYPQLKVVVDDRHDLYGERFLKQYLKVVRVEPGWGQILDEWNVNWAVVPATSSLSGVLQQSPQWSVVHKDATAILFNRASPIHPPVTSQ
jgi:hypothetical protein